MRPALALPTLVLKRPGDTGAVCVLLLMPPDRLRAS
jgi:hypothetical protein